jgi:hypothetical protein
LDLGKVVIRMTNTSSKALEAVLKTYKYMKESKTQDGRTRTKTHEKKNKLGATYSTGPVQLLGMEPWTDLCIGDRCCNAPLLIVLNVNYRPSTNV